MGRVLLLAAALASVLAASGAAGTTTIVRGALLRGPVSPVCVEGRPCSAPVPRATIVFMRGGRERARVTTNRQGRFSLRLSPGAYGVKLLGHRAGPLTRMTPRGVRVPADGAIWLRLDLDTGIRSPGPGRVLG